MSTVGEAFVWCVASMLGPILVMRVVTGYDAAEQADTV